MGMCCEKKTLIGWRNVWNMRWRAPDEEVDQRGRGERLCKKIAKHVIWTGRMLWIVVDGRSWYKDWIIRMVGGWMFLLVPAHLGSPGQRAVKRLLLLLFPLEPYPVSELRGFFCCFGTGTVASVDNLVQPADLSHWAPTCLQDGGHDAERRAVCLQQLTRVRNVFGRVERRWMVLRKYSWKVFVCPKTMHKYRISGERK